MSKKPSRTNIQLKHLTPKSAVKVFSFIEELLENHSLSKDFFDSKYGSFHPIEQYFICNYCQLYFNNKGSDIFLYKWLSKKQKSYDDNDEPEQYDQLDQSISKNQKRLLNVLPFYKKIAEKRSKDLIRYDIPIHLHSTFFKDDPINCKVPLISNTSKFREIFFEIWTELYTEQQVNQMFTNSFMFSSIDTSPKVLFLDVENKTNTSKQMAYTIKEYREHVNRQTEKRIIEHNKQLEKQTEYRRQFSKEYSYDSILRLSFAFIMYNTFPHYRDLYKTKSLKLPEYSKENFFDNMIKNFSTNRNPA